MILMMHQSSRMTGLRQLINIKVQLARDASADNQNTLGLVLFVLSECLIVIDHNTISTLAFGFIQCHVCFFKQGLW